MSVTKIISKIIYKWIYIGVIHRGNVTPSMQLLQPYLPNESGVSQSPYSEGGGVLALGLIHAPDGASTAGGKAALEYLEGILERARAEGNEVAREALLHGSCLGIG